MWNPQIWEVRLAGHIYLRGSICWVENFDFLVWVFINSEIVIQNAYWKKAKVNSQIKNTNKNTSQLLFRIL
jgi:hypothetical protein